MICTDISIYINCCSTGFCYWYYCCSSFLFYLLSSIALSAAIFNWMEASESAAKVYGTITTSMLDFIFHSAIRPIYWWNSYWFARNWRSPNVQFCTGVFVYKFEYIEVKRTHAVLLHMILSMLGVFIVTIACCIFNFRMTDKEASIKKERQYVCIYICVWQWDVCEHRRKSFSMTTIFSSFDSQTELNVTRYAPESVCIFILIHNFNAHILIALTHVRWRQIE